MSDDDEVLGTDELRFVDVLLEEHFAAAARTAPTPRIVQAAAVQRRSPLWAAAAALFAVAVLVGTWWLRREAAAPAQDPTPAPRATTPFEPMDDAELQAFLKQVVAIEAENAVTFAASPFGIDNPGGIRFRITDPDRCRALCTGWTPRGSANTNPPDAMGVRLWLTAGDGRQMSCSAGMRVYWSGLCWDAPNLDGMERMRDSAEQTAATLEALRSLPATRANLDCTALASADLQSELPRFRNLSRLVVTLDDTMAAVVAGCPTIEELSLKIPRGAHGITETAWQRIARLPHLHRLRITGDVALIEPSHLQHLRTLHALEIPRDPDLRSRAGLRHVLAISHLPALEELRIEVPWTSNLAADASQALTAMPTLRRLALGTDEPPMELLRLLKDSPIQKLHLAGFQPDEPSLDALAAARNLRELDLRCVFFADKAEGLLPTLQQLTRLDLRGTSLSAPQIADLKGWLTRCDVLASPGIIGSRPMLDGPSSWTENR